ncbi:MAG: cell envelope integrity protein TolA [Desulfarculaceae bacterium]|nr:cell envelope integrity protein TolA [Desulfarculaceae bacterium]MCF8074271.1 cell envelope integrity protein TolA [Desulfarculaceae bacterium]MCF8102970.1 cell envelope integrity protein TolA [Desulfarculaceae bacterium]MCF8117101.1 cell envelope integrity protein TolA [Desulfarculaceae bacterium]
MSAAALRRLGATTGEQVGWAIGVSLGLHVLLVGALAFWPGWRLTKPRSFAPVYNVALVSPSVLSRPAPAPPAPAKKAAPVKPAVTRPKPAPKPQPAKEAVALKKDQPKRIKPKPVKKQPDPGKLLASRLKKMERKVKAEQKAERSLASALNKLESKVATRQAGSGAFAAGAASADTNSLRFQVYYTEIWERVRRQWVLPEALVSNSKGLEAVVVARIRRDGSLSKVWLEKGSGNSRLDASAVRAVERAAPFPPLPSVVRGREHEVGLRFKPEDING